MKENLLKEIRKSLISWYTFDEGADILYVGKADDPCADIASQVLAPDELTGDRKYDYVISVATPEKVTDPVDLLKRMKSALKPGGHLFLGMNNRMGIRYFCGDRDIYTNRNFDGIENYCVAYMNPEDKFMGRSYDDYEICDMLMKSGWTEDDFQFWDVLPGLDYPTMLFSPDYEPNEDLSVRVFPEYNYPKSVFLEEEKLYDSLLKNGLFHKMANAYLIECSDGKLSDMMHVTSSIERGRKDALYTVVHRRSGKNPLPDTVEKKAAYPEGKNRILAIEKNQKILKAAGISTVDSKITDIGSLMMPYKISKTGQSVLKDLAFRGCRDEFLALFDRLQQLVMQSSEQVTPDRIEYLKNWEQLFTSCNIARNSDDFYRNFADGLFDGPILKNGFIDMVPLNSFYHNGDLTFFDQEFLVRDLPAKEIMWRCIATAYSGGREFAKCVPFDELIDRYGLRTNLNIWQNIEWYFLRRLRSEDELSDYHRIHRRNSEITNTNRQHINYSSDDYRRLFVDIFDKCDSRKVILFGSGTFAKKFMDIYRNNFNIDRILDNRKEKWGTEPDGIRIMPPDSIKDLSPGEYKVIICIKNYISVMKQLQKMGVHEFSIYDPAENYPRVINKHEEKKVVLKKKYHVGYIAGVFDLFHIGHLNMFKRAKEQCDHLIVGVVTDEGVRQFKRTEPFIPFEERIEMVRSCRYVDEAVDIPFMMRDTITAWKTLHFDVQFSGSDYESDPSWLDAKKFLREHGADLVFFPYTQQTSSTKIKALINKELEKHD